MIYAICLHLLGDVRVHAIVVFPLFLGGVQVESGARSKVVGVVLTLDPAASCHSRTVHRVHHWEPTVTFAPRVVSRAICAILRDTQDDTNTELRLFFFFYNQPGFDVLHSPRQKISLESKAKCPLTGAGVRSDNGDAVLGCVALRSRLRHKVLFRARQAWREISHARSSLIIS